jgi:hypothetical protein
MAESDTYHDDSSHGSVWETTDDEVKTRAKLTAFRMIERQDYLGSKVGTEKWPRTGLIDEEGIAVPSGSVPQFVKNAQFELELELILNPSVQTKSDTRDNIKQLKAGSTSLTKFQPQSGPRFPTIINEYLGRYLEGGLNLIMPTAGGIDEETGLSTYELNRGY